MKKQSMPERAQLGVVSKTLTAIDQVLALDNYASRRLWDVLTALRGPDQDTYASDEVKEQFTCFIRSAAFPRTARRVLKHAGTCAHGAMYQEVALDPKVRLLCPDVDKMPESVVSTHFRGHVRAALRVLVDIKRLQSRPEEPVLQEEE
jgi:hypothetical protein